MDITALAHSLTGKWFAAHDSSDELVAYQIKGLYQIASDLIVEVRSDSETSMRRFSVVVLDEPLHDTRDGAEADIRRINGDDEMDEAA